MTGRTPTASSPLDDYDATRTAWQPALESYLRLARSDTAQQCAPAV